MGKRWPDCAPDVRRFVLKTVETLQDFLKAKLDSVYLHGSLAMGSFYPPKSDIDLLILVNEKLAAEEQRSIHEILLSLNATRPITGSLELSIVLSETAKNPVHPIAYELHYGENMDADIRQGKIDYSALEKCDPDLAAHFTVTKARGISLYGPEPTQTLSDVPWQDYLDSVLADLEWILQEQNILTSPFYGVLNICRALQLLFSAEKTIANKEEGALWALEHLPQAHHEIIRSALECYRDTTPVASENRRKGGRNWNEPALLSFRDYAASAADPHLHKRSQ